MAKTQEELNQLKQECETLNNKLQELSDDELKQVSGGFVVSYYADKIDKALGMSYDQALTYFASFLQAFKAAKPDRAFFADEFENILRNNGNIDSGIFLGYSMIVCELMYFAQDNNYPDIAAKLQNIVDSWGN